MTAGFYADETLPKTARALRGYPGCLGRRGVKRGLTCSRCAARRRQMKRLTSRACRRDRKRETQTLVRVAALGLVD